MSKGKSNNRQQNSFLKFFSIISVLGRQMPKKSKQIAVAVCCALVIVGIVTSAVAAPKVSSVITAKAEDEQETTVAAPVKENIKQIKGIPIIVQDYYKAACETYACTMLLQGLGYDIDEGTFIDKYLLLKLMSWDEDGTMYGPDMNSAYAGDIFTGWGINSPAMAKSMNRFLDTQKDRNRAISIKGKTLDELCKMYIDRDIPVMTWVTTYMQESYVKNTWVVNYIDENAEYKIGDEVSWRQNEHCMVLIGYTDTEYIFNDSVAGKVVRHDKKTAETRFKEIGAQAVVVKDPFE